LKFNQTPRSWRIVATLGPSSESEETLEQLIRSGLTVARFNFSHGTHESHRELAGSLRRVASRLGEPVAILQDLQGHKVRTGRVRKTEAVHLESGTTVLLGTGAEINDTRIGIDYQDITRHVAVGQKVYLDDGMIRLEVVALDGDDLRCEVAVGGDLKSRKGVIFPDSDLSFPLINEKDLDDARLGVEIGVDMLAMSFVRSAAEVLEMRQRLAEWGEPNSFVIAKIEDPIGVANLEDILYVADAVLIARGDLGVTLPRECVPGVQKDIIRRANARGVAVITATQMLETMTHFDQPTRAEVNDVYNAVLDGTDAVMLSGETASGRFPVLAIQEMDRICDAATKDRLRYTVGRLVEGRPGLHSQVAEAAARMAQTTSASCILAFSLSGVTLKALSAARCPVPVYGVVAEELVRRRLQLHWGLSVITEPVQQKTADLIDAMLRQLVEQGICKHGDRIVVVGGTKKPQSPTSPTLKIHVVE
jgi:pyruvate kinase